MGNFFLVQGEIFSNFQGGDFFGFPHHHPEKLKIGNRKEKRLPFNKPSPKGQHFQVRRMRRSHYVSFLLYLPTHPPFLKCNGGSLFKPPRGYLFPASLPITFLKKYSATSFSPFHYNQFFINFILESFPIPAHQITPPYLYLSKLKLKYK